MRTFLLAIAASLLLVPAAAGARTSSLTLKLTPTSGPPTATVKAKGANFPPGSTETIRFDGTKVATALTDASGAFAVGFSVPASALPGLHTVAAVDPSGLRTSKTFLVQTDWPSARFDPAGSGFDPYENVLGPGNVGTLVERVAPHAGGAPHSAPIYAGGRVVVGLDDGTVRAYDPVGERQLWSFTTGGPVLASPLNVLGKPGVDCAVVAGSADGSLYGLDPITGRKLWSLPVGSPISTSPIAVPHPPGGGVHGIVIIEYFVAVADDGSLHAVNGCTGAPVWTRPTPSAGPIQSPVFLSSVQLADGSTHSIIIVAFGDGSVRAFDAADGSPLWSRAVDPVPSQGPVAYGSGSGARIVLGDGASVIELRAGTGATVWTRPTGGAVIGLGLYGVPAAPASPSLKISLRAVIAGDAAGDVEALAPGSGRILWSVHDPGPISAPPTIANGVVYLSEGSRPGLPSALVAKNAVDGGEIERADALNPQPFPPGPSSLGDGMVFLDDLDGGFGIFALPG
jgi:outer membrane protein assembly factor BamB